MSAELGKFRYQTIFITSGTCQSCLSTQCDPRTQASMNVCFILACAGPKPGQIRSDYRFKGIYGISEVFPTYFDWI